MSPGGNVRFFIRLELYLHVVSFISADSPLLISDLSQLNYLPCLLPLSCLPMSLSPTTTLAGRPAGLQGQSWLPSIPPSFQSRSPMTPRPSSVLMDSGGHLNGCAIPSSIRRTRPILHSTLKGDFHVALCWRLLCTNSAKGSSLSHPLGECMIMLHKYCSIS